MQPRVGCAVGPANGACYTVGRLEGRILFDRYSLLLYICGIGVGASHMRGMLADCSPAFSCFDGFRKAVGFAAPSGVVAFVAMAVRSKGLSSWTANVHGREA